MPVAAVKKKDILAVTVLMILVSALILLINNKEEYMETIFIKGELNGDTLTINDRAVAQCAYNTITLQIKPEYEDDHDTYFEFLCPNGRKVVSPAVHYNYDCELEYALPSSILDCPGKVYVQAVGYGPNSTVFKTLISERATFTVAESINAIDALAEDNPDLLERLGVTAEIYNQYRTDIANSEAAISAMVAGAQGVLEQVQASAAVKGIEGKSAFDTAVEAGYVGTEEAFAQQLSQMGDYLAAPRQDGSYLMQNGEWRQAVEPPQPNYTVDNCVPKVVNRNGNYIYAMMPTSGGRYYASSAEAPLNADSALLYNMINGSKYKYLETDCIFSADAALNNLSGRVQIWYRSTGGGLYQYICELGEFRVYFRAIGAQTLLPVSAAELLFPNSVRCNSLIVKGDLFGSESAVYAAYVALPAGIAALVTDANVPIAVLNPNSEVTAERLGLSSDIELKDGKIKLICENCPAATDTISLDVIIM